MAFPWTLGGFKVSEHLWGDGTWMSAAELLCIQNTPSYCHLRSVPGQITCSWEGPEEKMWTFQESLWICHTLKPTPVQVNLWSTQAAKGKCSSSWTLWDLGFHWGSLGLTTKGSKLCWVAAVTMVTLRVSGMSHPHLFRNDESKASSGFSVVCCSCLRWSSLHSRTCPFFWTSHFYIRGELLTSRCLKHVMQLLTELLLWKYPHFQGGWAANQLQFLDQ